MDPTEAADQIRELREEHAEEERFNSRAALIIAILAVLLAVASLGGGNVTENMLNANIHASDTWAFYQAKNVRQTVNRLAAEELEAELRLHADRASPAARAAIEETIAKYHATAERYESEPDPEDPTNPLKGDGKKELMAQARNWERQREEAMRKDPYFDYAEVLFQIAIVLGSVAILATSRPVLGLAVALGGAATLLMLNGYFLFVRLPFLG